MANVIVKHLFGGISGASGTYTQQTATSWTKGSYSLNADAGWEWELDESTLGSIEVATGTSTTTPAGVVWSKYSVSAVVTPGQLPVNDGSSVSASSPGTLNPVSPGVPAVPDDYIGTFSQTLTDAQKLQARTNVGLPFDVDVDGDILVTMELADVTGTVPDAHVLSRRGGAIVIGDGFTDGGILVEGAHNEMTIEVWANGVMKAYLIEDEMEGATYDIDGEGNYLSIGTAVTSLGDSFLISNSFILRISIPKSVTSFGDYCFMGSALTQIKIPNSVTSIGQYCFSGCGIPTFTIPPSVTVIGEQAFTENSSLTDIYCYVTETIFAAAGNQLTGSRAAGITIHARADDATWDALVAASPTTYQGHNTVTVIKDL